MVIIEIKRFEESKRLFHGIENSLTEKALRAYCDTVLSHASALCGISNNDLVFVPTRHGQLLGLRLNSRTERTGRV